MDKTATERALLRRCEDLSREAARDGFAAGKFLPPEQCALLEKSSRAFPGVAMRLFGGYDGAERCAPLFYDPALGYSEEALDALAGVAAMEVRSSGGEAMTHRAILGSALALGVERETIGDILPCSEDGGRAIFFTLRALVPFFTENLTRVGRARVTCREIDLPAGFTPERKTEELHLSVASPRIDCLAAAILHLSRERAADAVRAGLLAVNSIAVSDPAAPIREGDRVSARGAGRFDVTSLATGGQNRTRSGRLRVTVVHYLN